MKAMKRQKYRYFLMCFVITALLGTTGCDGTQEAAATQQEQDQTVEQKEYETVSVSNADKFSYQDLVVDGLSFGMTQEYVREVMGMPVTVYDSDEIGQAQNIIAERVYSYNDLTLIFSCVNDSYVLTAAASVSDDDVFARGIKVGDSIDDILNVYYRDANYKNQPYALSSTDLGLYLYGSFTIDSLDKVKSLDKIAYGIINYNGYESTESAESYSVEFTYFEPPYQNEFASSVDDYAQISFDIDNNGTITAIRWYYYPEQG